MCFGIWGQQALPTAIKFKNIQKKRFLFKNNGFLNKKPLFRFQKKSVSFVLLHRVPIATGTMNILCCRRGAPQAHLGLTFPSSGYKIPKNSKKPFFFKKKPFFFTNRFYFPCFFSNFITECPSPQAGGTYYAADAERRRRTSAQRCSAAGAQRRRRVDPSRKKLVARAKRGSRALTRRGE